MPGPIAIPGGAFAPAAASGCASKGVDAVALIHKHPRLPGPRLLSSPSSSSAPLRPAAGPRPRSAGSPAAAAKQDHQVPDEQEQEHHEAGGSSPSWPLPEAVTAHALRSAAVVAALCHSYAAFVPASHASFAEYEEPREWLPRRHHRRLGEWERTIPAVERVKAKYAVDTAGKTTISSVADAFKDTASELQKNFQSKKNGEFTMSMKAGPAPVKKPWESQVNANAANWAYVSGAVALGAVAWFVLKALGVFNKSSSAKGKWIRDRTLGGKMVFIPDNPEGPSVAAGSSSAASVLDKDFGQEVQALQAEAAKWRDTVSAPKATKDDGQMPTWWDPPPYMWVPDDRKATLAKQAKGLLKQAEDAKLAGSDYPLYTLVELQNKCAEGQVSVKPNTTNGRDAMLRLGMEAAIDCSIRGSNVTLGGLNPGRFVAGLAQAIDVPDTKAKSIANAAMAAKARSLLLGICVGFRTGNRQDIADPLRDLAAIVTSFPLSKGSAEADMMAASIKLAATLEERQGVMRLLYQMAPDSARVVAELLGFDPKMVIPLLEEESSPGGSSSL